MKGCAVSQRRPDPGPRPREPGTRRERRVGAWYHASAAASCASTSQRLQRHAAPLRRSTGLDHARRANYTVADGTTTKTINVTTAFDQGAWMHFPISVPAGGHVDITADRTAGTNVLLNGLFLGGAGAPPGDRDHSL